MERTEQVVVVCRRSTVWVGGIVEHSDVDS